MMAVARLRKELAMKERILEHARMDETETEGSNSRNESIRKLATELRTAQEHAVQLQTSHASVVANLYWKLALCCLLALVVGIAGGHFASVLF